MYFDFLSLLENLEYEILKRIGNINIAGAIAIEIVAISAP